MITTPNGARIPELLCLRRSKMIATWEKSSGQLSRKPIPALSQAPLEPSCGDEGAGAPQRRNLEPIDDDFRAARQSGYRVEIARVEDQRPGDEFLEHEPPAPIDACEVGGQSPACVERA